MRIGRIGLVNRGDYQDTETYEQLHFVYYEGSSYVAKKTTIGNKPVHDDEYWHILAKGGDLHRTSDVSNTIVGSITEFGGRVNIVIGDRISDIAGKVKRVFSDLKDVAFSAKYTDLEGRLTLTKNLMANEPGTALDASVGPEIKGMYDNLSAEVAQINSDLKKSGIMDNLLLTTRINDSFMFSGLTNILNKVPDLL